MLIVTRKPGEKIRIGDDITVIYCGQGKGNNVRIAIEAPKAIPVHREEVYDRIQAERAEARGDLQDDNSSPAGMKVGS